MARAAIFVPAAFGRERLRVEAAAAGAAIADPDGVEAQPELPPRRWRGSPRTTPTAPPRQAARAEAATASFREVAARLDGLYGSLGTRRRAARRGGDPLGDRPWILADLHMHTRWSHDCSIEVVELLDHAEARPARSSSPTTTSSARSRRSSLPAAAT